MLSIVVPTFRREAYLPPLFAAVGEQVAALPDPVELLLVDNSPEASAKGVPAPGFVRYLHEPRTGVAHARNRGVAEARGSHVIFLDDDELPAPGWLAAFAAVAHRGARAAFGAVEPRFESSPPPALLTPLDRIFSRRLPAAIGAEVQSLRAYLGSGNSMFARTTLALVDPPFDTSFNAGGEDVWLFRQLDDTHRIPMIWCPEALVHELVPPRRATMDFLRQRRFSDGQLRCLVESDAGGLRALARVALWMAVGAAQLVIFGLAAIVTRPFSEPRSVRLQLAAVGGAGKLLWWRRRKE
ncbi:glycosyltransferase family 2 protein [Tabrizicola sp.]|uniref:glycosyltransferase family 2 protein n=1 Tax=Tabrizicola sp. TaxID=2005166 RepID=UPI001A3EB2AD|nr:glycosyltransferase family 2 protein [Tabrizicola sp.]MBL9075331.1 glycosyltransferase [Tabrizicola sp.]